MGVQKIAEPVAVVDVMIVAQLDAEVIVKALVALNAVVAAAAVVMADVVETDAILTVKADVIEVAMANAVEALVVQIAQKHVIKRVNMIVEKLVRMDANLNVKIIVEKNVPYFVPQYAPIHV